MVPAHAGVVPVVPACHPVPAGGPRARGGGPSVVKPLINKISWSPRTRGWSWALIEADFQQTVVPAHAGVVPLREAGVNVLLGWSPRTRGWSRRA